MSKLCSLSILLLAISGSSLASILPLSVPTSAPTSSSVNLINTVVGAVGSTLVTLDDLVKAIVTNNGTLLQVQGANAQGVKTTLDDSWTTVNGALYVAGHLVTPQTLVAAFFANFLNIKNIDLNNPQYFADNAVILPGKDANDTTNRAGLMALPTYSLCGLGEQYKLTSCYICNQDCYVAHNLWGGKCGNSTVNGSPTCLCSTSDAEAKNRTTVPSSTETCAVGTTIIGVPTDLIVGAAFRIRSNVLQCGNRDDNNNVIRNQTGCYDDCVDNHGYTGGVCLEQYANVANPFYSSTEKNVFCICTTKDANGQEVLSTNGPDQPISPTTTTTTTTAAPATASQ